MTAEQTFKTNSRVLHKDRKATVRAVMRDRAMIAYDSDYDVDTGGKPLTMVSVAELEPNLEPDIPRSEMKFHFGYIQGVEDACEGFLYCQHLTGNDWSIGYRKGWDDAKANNIRSYGDRPFKECGGRK